MKTDIEIAQETELKPIIEIARETGIGEAKLESYGSYKAKLDYTAFTGVETGKLILVTAMTPTPAGEGKTTTTLGLADGLRRLGKRAIAAIREPSLGPVFGVKGGAAGGGYAQAAPMEDLNLHFTGDIHAVGAANNLLAAMVDNHVYQGNALGIDPRRISWRRCLDMNDRQLRFTVNGLGGRAQGSPREDSWDITAASEVMAVLCLAGNLEDLKERLASVIVGYTYGGEPVRAAQLNAQGAMAALLKDALKPNLIQTLEHTPVLVHGGPFANIAHGCSSLIATKLALKLGEYVVTEAGFGADLGAEKFFDIKCRIGGLIPSAAVLVASIRSLKYHGGLPRGELEKADLSALERGLPNLLRHAGNLKSLYGLPVAVAVNRFPTDTLEELALVEAKCREMGVKTVLSEVWARGGAGGLALAEETVRICGEASSFRYGYALESSIIEKIEAVAKRVYRAGEVKLTPEAHKQALEFERSGFGGLPVCIAKTQYSFSDNQRLPGAPEGFTLTVGKLRVSAGAGFIVAFTGDIMTMPGLPRLPSAEGIDVDPAGKITGLF
ncbi:MAG: formate--tetrahydrofolate ligase [Treponema sp.]|jgi:formate--tetrahydrofolate ligase|nr:formate--tetrahydrofolate ligase [Treponema sp.]